MPAYVLLMPAKDLIAGLAASWVKALTEPRLQALAEAILPPSPSQKQDVGADPRRGSGLTGLGDRIEALGGKIRIESQTGSGTILEVEIPIA